MNIKSRQKILGFHRCISQTLSTTCKKLPALSIAATVSTCFKRTLIQYFGSDPKSILQSVDDGWHAQISQTNLRNVLDINNLKQNECTKKVQPIQCLLFGLISECISTHLCLFFAEVKVWNKHIKINIASYESGTQAHFYSDDHVPSASFPHSCLSSPIHINTQKI